MDSGIYFPRNENETAAPRCTISILRTSLRCHGVSEPILHYYTAKPLLLNKVWFIHFHDNDTLVYNHAGRFKTPYDPSDKVIKYK